MTKRNVMERFCIWWWDEEGEDWIQQLSFLLGWPVPIETDNMEYWDGGEA